MEGGKEKLNHQRIEEKLKRRKDRINKILLESRIGIPPSKQEQQPSSMEVWEEKKS